MATLNIYDKDEIDAKVIEAGGYADEAEASKNAARTSEVNAAASEAASANAAAATVAAAGAFDDVYTDEAAMILTLPVTGTYFAADTGNLWSYDFNADEWTFLRNMVGAAVTTFAGLAARHGNAGAEIAVLEDGRAGAFAWHEDWAAAQAAYGWAAALTEAQAQAAGLASDAANDADAVWVRAWYGGSLLAAWAGVVADGATDDLAALVAARAAASLTGAALELPAGTLALSGAFALSSDDDGLLVYGQGARTVLQAKNLSASPNAVVVLDGADDVTLRDLTVDGNRAETAATGYTVLGVLAGNATACERLTLHNVRVRNAVGTGLALYQGSVTGTGIYATGNGGHGVGLGLDGTKVLSAATISNVQASGNGAGGSFGYGLNVAALTRGSVVGFYASGNLEGGMKTATNVKRFTLDAAYAESNTGVGFRMNTPPADAEWVIGTAVSVSNGGRGFEFQQGSGGARVEAGTLVSYGDNAAGSGDYAVLLSDHAYDIGLLVIRQTTEGGLYVATSGPVWIGRLVTEGVTSTSGTRYAARFSEADGVTVGSGYVSAAGTYGVRAEAAAGRVHLAGVRFADGASPMTAALYNTGGDVVCTSCDFTGATTKWLMTGGGDLRFAGEQRGATARAQGTQTASGDGATVAFSWAHGLSDVGSGRQYRVVAQAASAAAAGAYYVSVSSTNITVTYTVAPASGTSNLSWRWQAETWAE